jgi:hypothetical protein
LGVCIARQSPTGQISCEKHVSIISLPGNNIDPLLSRAYRERTLYPPPSVRHTIHGYPIAAVQIVSYIKFQETRSFSRIPICQWASVMRRAFLWALSEGLYIESVGSCGFTIISKRPSLECAVKSNLRYIIMWMCSRSLVLLLYLGYPIIRMFLSACHEGFKFPRTRTKN